MCLHVLLGRSSLICTRNEDRQPQRSDSANRSHLESEFDRRLGFNELCLVGAVRKEKILMGGVQGNAMRHLESHTCYRCIDV